MGTKEKSGSQTNGGREVNPRSASQRKGVSSDIVNACGHCLNTIRPKRGEKRQEEKEGRRQGKTATRTPPGRKRFFDDAFRN